MCLKLYEGNLPSSLEQYVNTTALFSQGSRYRPENRRGFRETGPRPMDYMFGPPVNCLACALLLVFSTNQIEFVTFSFIGTSIGEY